MIVPLGDVSQEIINVVARVVSDVFGIRPVSGKHIKVTDKIDVDFLLADAVKKFDYDATIFVTTQELWSSRYQKRVYGYSNIDIPVCVVSTDGLWENDVDTTISWKRFIKVCVHEIGHTFGLEHHMKLTGCVMDAPCGEGMPIDIDVISKEFCQECKDIVSKKRK